MSTPSRLLSVLGAFEPAPFFFVVLPSGLLDDVGADTAAGGVGCALFDPLPKPGKKIRCDSFMSADLF